MRLHFYCWAMLLATTLFSCSDSDSSDNEELNYIIPTVTTNFEPTQSPRTHLDGSTGEVSWKADDQLLVFVHETGKKPATEAAWTNCRYKFVTNAELCTTNKFKQASNEGRILKLDPSKKYDWYVMSPYSETVTSPEGHGTFTIGDVSSSIAEPTLHVGNTDLLAGTHNNMKAEADIPLSLKHLTTLMMFRVSNQLTETVKPQYVEFQTNGTIPATIAGDFKINFAGSVTPVNGKNVLRVNYDGKEAVQPNASFDVYAVMPSFSLNAGDQFNLHVVTDKSNTKQISTMRQSITFSAGTINRAKARITSKDVENNINPWISQGEFEDNIPL